MSYRIAHATIQRDIEFRVSAERIHLNTVLRLLFDEYRVNVVNVSGKNPVLNHSISGRSVPELFKEISLQAGLEYLPLGELHVLLDPSQLRSFNSIRYKRFVGRPVTLRLDNLKVATFNQILRLEHEHAIVTVPAEVSLAVTDVPIDQIVALLNIR